MMTVTGSKRSALGTLSPKPWRSLRSAVRRHAGRRAAILLPAEAPSRHQYLYAENKLLARGFDLLQERFEARTVQQALAQGLFPTDIPRNRARPERRQLLAGDATVPKAPSRAERAEIEDTTTGEIRTHRVDPAARLYHENGEDKKTVVRGTKWFFASARDDGYRQRVILAVQHVAGGEYEDEAAIAVRSFARLHAQLPGAMGVVYDGAFRGVHRDTLGRRGLLVINKRHGSVKPRACVLLRPGRRRHDLGCDQGRIAERILLDDGTSHPWPVPVIRLEHREGVSKSRWYHLLRIDRRHGSHTHRVPVGITSTPADRARYDPSTGKRIPSDTERGFHRAEYLQQIPEATRAHRLVHPYRSDVESLHNQLDQSMWNKRMISHGLDRQKIFMLGFVLARNATSHQVHLERRPQGASETAVPSGV